MFKSIFICMSAVACLAALAVAQQPAPQQSAVKMGSKSITLKYSAPSMAGRKIFGGVVPYNQVWRAGSPVFHTDADLDIQGLAVPKGDYTLYVLPNAKEWMLIVSKQTGPQAAAYSQKMDLGRVPMDMKKSGAPAETLRMTLKSFGSFAGSLELAWEDTVASVPFSINAIEPNREW
jgi:hypothetical protein